MKKLTLKEKFLSILHILLDYECAVYIVTVKDGKRVNGRELTDVEVREIIEYGIDHGYEFDIDIPSEEVGQVLNWK